MPTAWHSLAWSLHDGPHGPLLWCGMNAFYKAMHFALPPAPGGWMRPGFADARWEFRSRDLNGQPMQRPRDKRGISFAEGMLGEAIGRQYVAEYFPADGDVGQPMTVGTQLDDWLAAQRNRGRTVGLVDRSPSPIERLLAPLSRDARIVTVMDGHPLALSWLGSVRGQRVVPLGIEKFGQSGDIPDLYRTYGLDSAAIIDAVARAV